MTAAPQAERRARILLVDDERNVLDALSLHLRRKYDTVTAVGAAAGLDEIQQNGPPAVVVSDMRMPGMDGAKFLAKVREGHPDTARMLLTGQADIASAIAAINEGQIFRFLTKPCAPQMLLAAIEAAVTHHRLVTAERVLLEQTLHGSIAALVEVLGLTNPISFGWTMRVKALVADLAREVGLTQSWQVEVAAMLSQLAYVTLPIEVADKVHNGQPLSEQESEMVARIPATTERLLAHIPRIEVVRGILKNYTSTELPVPRAGDTDADLIRRGAQLLGVATRFDRLMASGNSAAIAIGTLRAREPNCDPAVFDALTKTRGGAEPVREVRDVLLVALRVGMVVADEVRMSNGALLVPRGFAVTESFVERCRNVAAGSIVEPVRVIMPLPQVNAA